MIPPSINSAQFPAASPRRKGERGFALIIAVTLLAFVVLLVVGLAALTKVETNISDNSAKQAQARANALMALNIALGQLQKYAGPDTHVTATGEAFSGAHGAKYYTGVWDSTTTGATPMTWLVSGSENPSIAINDLLTDALDPTTDAQSGQVFLVGDNTVSDKSQRVKLSTVPLHANVPGLGDKVAGSYAWWVGDEGVKASVALPDRSQEVAFSDWSNATQRERLRLQLPTSSYFASTANSGAYIYDSMALASESLEKILSRSQLSNATFPQTPEIFKQRYSDFTTFAESVLANTQSGSTGGLMRDLSMAPTELGPAFAKYSDFHLYLDNGSSARPQIAGDESMRRRYEIVAPVETPASSGLPAFRFSVAPVITDFLLQFGLTRPASGKVAVKARLYIGLWNPYTSALVPPSDATPLTVEVSGLPAVTPINSVGESGASIDLQNQAPSDIVGSNSLQFRLSFSNPSAGTASDTASWLPGRYYFWTTPTGAGPSGLMRFYNKTLNASGWIYPAEDLAMPSSATATVLGVTVPEVQGITVTLKNNGVVLATYQLPDQLSVNLTPSSSNSWKFGYSFRVHQPSTLDAARDWLSQYDPRGNVQADMLDPFDPSRPPNDPSGYYDNSPTTSGQLTQYLIYRVGGKGEDSTSPYNDVPLFELPRMPILSLGELQQLQISEARPFSAGNSWGGSANRIYDMFFFSGLSSSLSGPNVTEVVPFPNWHLHVVDSRSGPAQPLDLDVIRTTDPAHTSRFLLQRGGFNVNSLSTVAWRTVLGSLRIPVDQPFQYAEMDTATGSQNGASASPVLFNEDSVMGSDHPQPVFVRFPQSAQETYEWAPSAHAQDLSTQAFRMGIRGYNSTVTDPTRGVSVDQQWQQIQSAQISDLADKIVELVADYQLSNGPFRSLESFLSPSSGKNRSIIEQAIAASAINPSGLTDVTSVVGVNNSNPGFSSLTLTQADILNSVAPFLRCRSDTFVIRAYGNVLNPVTNKQEGQAWLQARVQRLPATLDSSDDIVHPSSSGLGRRFQILSIRWLSDHDI